MFVNLAGLAGFTVIAPANVYMIPTQIVSDAGIYTAYYYPNGTRLTLDFGGGNYQDVSVGPPTTEGINVVTLPNGQAATDLTGLYQKAAPTAPLPPQFVSTSAPAPVISPNPKHVFIAPQAPPPAHVPTLPIAVEPAMPAPKAPAPTAAPIAPVTTQQTFVAPQAPAPAPAPSAPTSTITTTSTSPVPSVQTSLDPGYGASGYGANPLYPMPDMTTPGIPNPDGSYGAGGSTAPSGNVSMAGFSGVSLLLLALLGGGLILGNKKQ